MFKYATKELSQDAFICWCINWINYRNCKDITENEKKLCKMSETILNKILESKGVDSTHIEKVNIVRQFENIDITLTITTKSLKQYLVIIEDKKEGILNKNQKETLYLDKLLKSINNTNKDKQEINREKLGIETEITRDRIILTYWKTSKWEENRENLQKELENNLQKEVICIDGIETLDILRAYKENSEIIRDFYNCLEEELKANNTIKQVEEISNMQKIKIGTKFEKNYYCYNCFKKITGKEYTKKSHPQIGGIALKEINKKLNKKNLVHVNTINLFNTKEKWQNEFKDNYNLWVENISENFAKRGKLHTDIKYVFVFGKSRDAFRRNQYTFMGIYKFIKYDEKNNIRVWERQNRNEEIVPIDEDSIIKIIEKCEKRNRYEVK